MGHLTQEQRYTISQMLGNGYRKIEIARVIGVDKSTVSGKLNVRPTGVIGGNDTKQQAKKAFRIFNTQREAGSNIVYQKSSICSLNI